MKSELGARRTYKTSSSTIRRLRIKQNAPVKINKMHLITVLKIFNADKSKKLKHKVIEEYGKSAQVSLKECLMPSIEAISSFSPLTVFSNSTSTLLYQLRRSLLNHDWDYHLKLMQTLIRCNQINKRSLIYIIRSSLILLMNHVKGTEVLREYFAVCLGINDEEKISNFLRSIFVMPEKLKLGVILETLKSKKSDLSLTHDDVTDLV